MTIMLSRRLVGNLNLGGQLAPLCLLLTKRGIHAFDELRRILTTGS
jgi:hypothetical protein